MGHKTKMTYSNVEFASCSGELFKGEQQNKVSTHVEIVVVFSCWRPVLQSAFSLSLLSSLCFFCLSLLQHCCGFDGQQILWGLAAFNSQLKVSTQDGGRKIRGVYKTLQSQTDSVFVCVSVCTDQGYFSQLISLSFKWDV